MKNQRHFVDANHQQAGLLLTLLYISVTYRAALKSEIVSIVHLLINMTIDQEVKMESQADNVTSASIWFEGETTDNRRQIERQPASVGAKLKSPYGTGKVVRVDDISPEGCRITVAHLCAGDRVYIQIGGMEPWLAEVRWSDEDQAGFKFAHPLHPAVALHLSSSGTSRRQ